MLSKGAHLTHPAVDQGRIRGGCADACGNFAPLHRFNRQRDGRGDKPRHGGATGVAPGIHHIGFVIGDRAIFFRFQRHTHDHAVRLAFVIGIVLPELVGHLLEARVTCRTFQRFNLGKHIFPRIGPAVQAQGAAHKQIGVPVRIKAVFFHERQAVPVGIDLETFGLRQRGVIGGNRIPWAGHVKNLAAFQGSGW